MYEEIANQIAIAEGEGSKMAMFHYQVLIHAGELIQVDAILFCQLVGVLPSYRREFHKMLSLARIMEQQGVRLTEANM